MMPLRIGRPRLGLRARLGLVCFLLVLVPSLGAAELIVQGYEARATADARERALGGLDAAAGLIDQERIRALSNAESAAGRLGRSAQDGSSEELVRVVSQTRAALRTTLVAVVDGGGRTLASDSASNLPFGSHGEVRAALQGRSAAGLQERASGIAVQAAAPLRIDGEILPGAAVVAQNLDDGFLNGGLRLSGLEMALVQNGRLVAASRGLRRSFAFASDQSLDVDLLGQPGDTFKRTRFGSETFFLAARAVMAGNRELGTLLVGRSADAVAEDARQARLLTYGAGLFGAAAAGLAGALVGGWLAQRLRALAQRARLIARDGAGPMAPSRGEPWGEVGRALEEADQAVAKRLAELRFRAERLEAVLASVAEGVIVADERRRVVLVNPAARALLSLPAGGEDQALALLSDDTGRVGAEGRPPVVGAPVFAPLLRPSAGSGDPGAQSLAPLRTANERVIRSYSASVQDEAGRLLGTVTVLRDATREQELDRLKSEFLTVVSHELQTPLTALKGALELVAEDDDGRLSRVQRRFLGTMGRNCERLVGLVGDLLDLSRLEAGGVELDPRPLDTPSVVRGAVASLANLFEARGIAVSLDLPEDLPPLRGDRRRVDQILTNLLGNAAKYTPRGGRVEVAAWSVDGRVALAVTDSGPGIPDAERDMVFDKFYRGRDASRRGDGGSGLGLAIARSLVDLHGGSIAVESGTGTLRGARFVVELPRAVGEE